jgi:hypothetical protein
MAGKASADRDRAEKVAAKTFMRIWGIVLLIGVLSTSAFSQKETVAQLVDRAKTVSVDHQPDLYIRAAEQELKIVTQLYNDGKAEEAAAGLNDVVAYSDYASDTATKSRKRVKNIEIGLRKMTEKLRDVKRTLNFEDQPAVQTAMDHMENLRTNLLALMFGKEKK